MAQKKNSFGDTSHGCVQLNARSKTPGNYDGDGTSKLILLKLLRQNLPSMRWRVVPLRTPPLLGKTAIPQAKLGSPQCPDGEDVGWT